MNSNKRYIAAIVSFGFGLIMALFGFIFKGTVTGSYFVLANLIAVIIGWIEYAVASIYRLRGD